MRGDNTREKGRRDRSINFSREPASAIDPLEILIHLESGPATCSRRLQTNFHLAAKLAQEQVCVRLPTLFLFLPFFLILFSFSALLSFSRNHGVNNARARARGIRDREMLARKRVEYRQKCRSGCRQKSRFLPFRTCANLFPFLFFFHTRETRTSATSRRRCDN